MLIAIDKITNSILAQRACEFTIHKDTKSNISLSKLYRCMHSPIRTQLFWIEMYDIPSFVSTHLVRHSVGVTHYVQTNRDDRGADYVADRNTLVRHAMLINAEALINMARKRLCKSAHLTTISVMKLIKESVCTVDEELSRQLVPECVYRNRYCPELRCCGYVWSSEYEGS